MQTLHTWNRSCCEWFASTYNKCILATAFEFKSSSKKKMETQFAISLNATWKSYNIDFLHVEINGHRHCNFRCEKFGTRNIQIEWEENKNCKMWLRPQWLLYLQMVKLANLRFVLKRRKITSNSSPLLVHQIFQTFFDLFSFIEWFTLRCKAMSIWWNSIFNVISTQHRWNLVQFNVSKWKMLLHQSSFILSTNQISEQPLIHLLILFCEATHLSNMQHLRKISTNYWIITQQPKMNFIPPTNQIELCKSFDLQALEHFGKSRISVFNCRSGNNLSNIF